MAEDVKRFDGLAHSTEYAAATQFALMFAQYKSEPDGIREAIDSMVAIMSDPEATETEKMLATHTLMEAFFPKDPIDW